MATESAERGNVHVLLTAVVLGLVSLLLQIFWRRIIAKNGRGDSPPMHTGWFPWIGCAVEFGKAPVHFIEAKRKEMGPVYTLLVAGEHMTFLLDPEDFHLFFQSPNVDFQKAVQLPVQRVASVTEESFFTYHTKIHDTVKGKLAAGQLTSLYPKLRQGFAEGLDHIKKGDYELHDVVRGVMYRTVLDNLFGKGVLPTLDQDKYKELERHFVMFDDLFEYGAKLPPFFLREWSTSKGWLLKMFGQVVQRVDTGGEEEKKTVLQSLLSVVDAQHAPNYSLLLMWASLANAIPIMFWTLAFVLDDKRVVEKARQEVMSTVGTSSEVREESLASMPYLKCCILEAIRLRSPGIITRRVVKPFKVKNMTVPAGDMVMVSPFWAHRNPTFFPDPHKFLPERWLSADLEKNVFLEGFIAFGGGRYQCPGRWFALLELHLFLALFIQRFDCKLQGAVPDFSPLHLVGTQQPVGPCPVHIENL
ncbi:24-hydroxycholesterol 7-alpha-hydroxylase-like [Littorina saxatilis]|uniref:24-hydroxycholesterol 7-alpha-hydroxylase n=1 Tax=Littorina saxatilis TaxID=31220 RepID=A0AAN9GGR1_9CAEN